MISTLTFDVTRQGLLDISAELNAVVREVDLEEGLCTLFIQHTSASLLVQESYDPSARRDLESWLNRLVPENDPLYTHTLEGSDDMPAHIKAALTASSVSIPVIAGELALGTWQGVYLWEHRHQPGRRRIIIHLT
ncbi:hypothetical protein A9Q88_07515 [Gammaproteobacteria bacterium 50_400_T64]|nr:hypothetical protein A9Q88_07515 [Gammaproteobacteria bacterium 50_400_T64]